MPITSLSSCDPRKFSNTAHGVITKKGPALRIVRFRGIAFVLSDIALVILKLSPDGASASIADVACRAYGLLMCTTTLALEGSGD